MKNNSLVAGRWSLVAGRWSLVAGRWSLVAGLISLCIAVTANAQSISNAWNSAPSNCDTGCAQSGLVSVAGSNSGSDGNWRLVYSGSLTSGSISIPSTAKILYVQGKCGNTNINSWMFPSSYSGVFADCNGGNYASASNNGNYDFTIKRSFSFANFTVSTNGTGSTYFSIYKIYIQE